MSETTTSVDSVSFELSPADNPRLANLCGHLDEHIRMMERGFGVEINNRGVKFQIIGHPDKLSDVQDVIFGLYAETAQAVLAPEQVHLAIREVGGADTTGFEAEKEVTIKTKRGLVKARGDNQQEYLRRIMTHDINFGVGPAGTGKTLLTLAAALTQCIEHKRYGEIIMTRVTVPVGEDIGFLPGTEEEKMTPWMGALMDNLEVLNKTDGGDWGRQATNDLLQRWIKIRSLNFMRGRTFLNRFIIIDEAQNLTSKQMKTLITRAGPGTKIVCLGNISQIDTPYLSETTSGLTYVVDHFKNWPHSGHITLLRGERSRLADFASENL